MIMITVKYSCPVIDTPKELCPHFKECLKNGKKKGCLLTKEECKKCPENAPIIW